jgi:hypothetical protein
VGIRRFRLMRSSLLLTPLLVCPRPTYRWRIEGEVGVSRFTRLSALLRTPAPAAVAAPRDGRGLPTTSGRSAGCRTRRHFRSAHPGIDSPASLEHASPADATARYFAELFESQTQSECRIADGHGSLHWQRPQQIDHSTPECGNPLTFDLTNIEICQGGHMEMDIATDLAAQD